jgi:hypothetical protein
MAGRQERAFQRPPRIAGASALALILLSACGPKAATQAAAPPAPQPPAAAARPVLSSNLDQIQNQYAADPAGARSKFQKVAVQFTALADTVDAPPGQDLVIGFHTAQHPQPIRAVFLKTAAEGHASVKTGDMVMTRCDQVVEVAGKPELHDCAFR